MIIGNGLIAKSFIKFYEDDPDKIVFASGVSNSQNNQSKDFMREEMMLVDALSCQKLLVYFSTCSIGDPELKHTPYVQHKKKMEALVSTSKDYSIFRLPQVVGRTPNPYTLTNYLYKKIMSGDSFQVWGHAKRNLIDVDDIASIISYMIGRQLCQRKAINIASANSILISHLVDIFELVLDKKANFSLIDSGGEYSIDSSLANEVAGEVGIDFDDAYIEKLIRKYYGE